MPEELDGTVYFLEFSPNRPWKPYPTMPRHIHGAISRHICEILHLVSFDEADRAFEISLFNFAYSDTKGALDRRINNFAKAARRNFTSVSEFTQPELYVSYGH